MNNLPETTNEVNFPMDIPDYKIQQRDILYITIKGMAADGKINDFLPSSPSSGSANYIQGEAGQYMFGYDVNNNGEILVPVLGTIKVGGVSLSEARSIIQKEAEKQFNNVTADCKLLSFKFTVIGEVKSPGTYVNYNNYLTILEAIGRAGGLTDFGRRDKILIVRPVSSGTMTYTLDLKDKSILTSKAYFLLPNDVVIIQPMPKKIFNLNFPTYTAIFAALTSALSTTLLLINYFGK